MGMIDRKEFEEILTENIPTWAIPKSQYEARLKADMLDMLTELQLEIKEKAIRKQGIDSGFEYDYEFISSEEVIEIIQQKINALKVDKEVEDGPTND